VLCTFPTTITIILITIPNLGFCNGMAPVPLMQPKIHYRMLKRVFSQLNKSSACVCTHACTQRWTNYFYIGMYTGGQWKLWTWWIFLISNSTPTIKKWLQVRTKKGDWLNSVIITWFCKVDLHLTKRKYPQQWVNEGNEKCHTTLTGCKLDLP
jgi:hypothetical protein